MWTAAQEGMPGGPRISMPYSAAAATTGARSDGGAGGGGMVGVGAGWPIARMKERVGDVARPVDKWPGGRLDDLAADPEGEPALGDVEPLVFAVVDVQSASRGSSSCA